MKRKVIDEGAGPRAARDVPVSGWRRLFGRSPAAPSSSAPAPPGRVDTQVALEPALREREVAEQSRLRLQSQLRAVVDAVPTGVAISRDRRFEIANTAFCAMLGWGGGELIGRSPFEVYSSINADDKFGTALRTAFAAGLPWQGDVSFRRRDGSAFAARLQGRMVDRDDPAAGTVWLLAEAGASSADRAVAARNDAAAPGIDGHGPAEQAAQDFQATQDVLSQRDDLTGLLNRDGFEAQLVIWLSAAPADLPASLLLLDLDGFKQVNDRLGRAAGDGLLRDVARVLGTHVRGGDLLARLDGDSYALLLPGCVAAVALQLGERLRRELAALHFRGHGGQAGAVRVSATIGVAEVEPATRLSAAEWMARAQAAWYEAKYGERGRVRLARATAGLPLVAG